MYNLFLDDMRNPNKFLDDVRTWEIAKSYTEFVKIIQARGMPGFISFDHDLPYQNPEHPVEKSGYDCARWLIEYCMKTSQPLPEFQVHSMNPNGKINIQCLLDSYKKIQNSTDYE